MTVHRLVWAIVAIIGGGTFAGAAISVSRELAPPEIRRLTLPPTAIARTMLNELRSSGFDCPHIAELSLVQRPSGKVMKVVCGGIAAPDLASVMIVVRGTGPIVARPWDTPLHLRGAG